MYEVKFARYHHDKSFTSKMAAPNLHKEAYNVSFFLTGRYIDDGVVHVPFVCGNLSQ